MCRLAQTSSALFAVALLAACASSTAKQGAGRLSIALPGDDGQPISSADFRGRVLVVHVFTTWSLPAQDDALRLEREFGNDDRIAVLGVVLDVEAPVVISAWRRGMAVTYPIAISNDAIRSGKSALGDARAVPFTVVFDENGAPIHRIQTPLGEAGTREIRRRSGVEAPSGD